MHEHIAERFLDKISPEPNSGCWLWDASLDGKGYGQFMVPQDGVRKLKRAHRISYEMYKGPIPEGLDLDHLCRVPSCVNPDHLEPVTRGENLRRGNMRENNGLMAKAHCPNGHEYLEGTWRYYRPPKREHAHRQCLICFRENQDRHARKSCGD